ncbi:MAG: cellulase family glycosylhydrolase, partial [Anaerolineae bacterium]
MPFTANYNNLRGFNYVPTYARNDIEFWRDYDGAVIERELGYAQRLGLNSARVFLAYVVYEQDRAAFLARVKHFVRAAHDRGISTMVVVWDSCFSEVMPTYEADEPDWVPNPGVQRLTPDFWPQGEGYCADLVEALCNEPGLLMWDMMNEPLITSWYWAAEGKEKEHRRETIWAFARHFCGVMGRLDPSHPRTVGVSRPGLLPNVIDCVDVVSFHDYSATRGRIRAQLAEGIEMARQAGKPVLVSEVGCLARANPYDVCLEICRDLGIGWYLWELMIGKSRWNDIHGIVY